MEESEVKLVTMETRVREDKMEREEMKENVVRTDKLEPRAKREPKGDSEMTVMMEKEENKVAKVPRD